MVGALPGHADGLGRQDSAGQVDERPGGRPGRTVAGAPSSVTRAVRRVGSRLPGDLDRDAVADLDHGDVVAGGARAGPGPARRRARCRPTPEAVPSRDGDRSRRAPRRR